MQYTVHHDVFKNDNFQFFFLHFSLTFAQNVESGYTLEPPQIDAILTSTHYLCFKAKIRKNGYPCKPQVYSIKVGCKGVLITQTC